MEELIKAIVKRIKGKGHLVQEGPDDIGSDDVAIFIGQLLYFVGAKIRLKVVSQEVDKPFHHCYIEIYYPAQKKWLALDPEQATKPFPKSKIVTIVGD